MKKKLFAAMLLLIPSSLLASEDKIKHFPSLEAPDVTTALQNLQDYNKKLGQIVNKADLSAEDMVKVHELTYTLENAVIRLKLSLDSTAEALEKVHLASESLDQQTIKQQGELYLQSIKMLTNEN